MPSVTPGSSDSSDTQGEVNGAIFEERAENLSLDQFSAWTEVSPFERTVLRQLMAQGPRLLSGPRGCGKTTLLRLADRRINSTTPDIAVYVNYGKYLFLEPAYKQRADADGFFQDWLVARIIVAISDHVPNNQKLKAMAKECQNFVDAAESDPSTDRLQLPGPAQLSRMLEMWASEAGHRRVILLLDDAAHAFVPDQQRVFFEFLRSIRNPNVTYKAAIYPGVTEFSPNFHVGHDAKIIHAWIPVDGEQYLRFMRSLFTRRFPDSMQKGIPGDVVDLFAGAAFGVPRTFLAMLEEYLNNLPTNSGRIARQANTIIGEQAQQLRKLYMTLADKLPSYSMYVETGLTVEQRIVSELRDLNSTRFDKQETASQALDVAIRQPIDQRLLTILSLLEYAGIVRQTNESVSLGSGGTFTKFSLHGAVLMEGNALRFGKNPTLAQRAGSLIRFTRVGTYKRVLSETLLNKSEAKECRLMVGSCQNCGSPRLIQEARFCHVCGSELLDESRFAALLRTPVDQLPLTPRKIESLKNQRLLRVEDILRDRGQQELRKAERVGQVWARRIYSVAEEFVSV
ncbi:ATP-binding protein [Kribbella catacumbae]|uniref:ATP-binding protein n=1 Tax=Kribbella catacumbae TaxID=460086 RepID=UPI0003A3C2F1|nr:ATP-binding protein [Kribbella catacumbae]